MHLPAAVFSSLSKLTKLTVSHTAIRTLPPTLARMPNLSHLTVTHSRGITLLPELAIKGLTALKGLELQHCRIQRLPVNALNSLSNLTSLSAAGRALQL
jgi:Leucine-rich repeat (LRR) protein